MDMENPATAPEEDPDAAMSNDGEEGEEGDGK